MLRYTAAGSLDTGFGVGGIKIIPVSAAADSTADLALRNMLRRRTRLALTLAPAGGGATMMWWSHACQSGGTFVASASPS